MRNSDDYNVAEEIRESLIASSAATIVSVALFSAMMLVWFMVLAPGAPV